MSFSSQNFKYWDKKWSSLKKGGGTCLNTGSKPVQKEMNIYFGNSGNIPGVNLATDYHFEFLELQSSVDKTAFLRNSTYKKALHLCRHNTVY